MSGLSSANFRNVVVSMLASPRVSPAASVEVPVAASAEADEPEELVEVELPAEEPQPARRPLPSAAHSRMSTACFFITILLLGRGAL